MKKIIQLTLTIVLISCTFPNQNLPTKNKVVKTEKEWKTQLSEQEYYVTREKGTERAFTGEYHDYHGEGSFNCKCCQQPLFDAKSKFDSGTGWPSFFEAINDTAIIEHKDASYGMVRTEVVCSRCDAHLGHLFQDGPQPTGLRYCINSVSLSVEK